MTPLDIRQLEGEDKGYWQYLSELRYLLDNGFTHSIEPGRKTDLQSIPRLGWSAVGHPLDEAAVAGSIHDDIYQRLGRCLPPGHAPYTRREGDEIYLQINRDKKVGWVRRTTKHWFVRAFGWRSWNRYRAADAKRARAEAIVAKIQEMYREEE